MRHLTKYVFLGLVALASLLSLSLAVALSPGTARAADDLELTEDEQEVVRLTNRERRAEGLEDLVPNAKLFAAARGHSKNMAKQKTLAHKLDGKSIGERLDDAGYTYTAAAENIGNQQTAAKVVAAWIADPRHEKNILGDYTEIGVGVAKDADGNLYWAQDFGKR